MSPPRPTPRSASGQLIDVRVVPRAGRSGIAGVRDGALLVRLAAAPVDGAANAELIEVLAKALGLPKRSIEIVSGDRARSKRVQITGMTAGAVWTALGLPKRSIEIVSGDRARSKRVQITGMTAGAVWTALGLDRT
jgi:uncharacterized protein (TIGR00251 family)